MRSIGQGAQTAYFAGCSTGGQNALMEAQRFPEDYNGILAGARGVQSHAPAHGRRSRCGRTPTPRPAGSSSRAR